LKSIVFSDRLLAIYSDLKNDELGKIIDMATEVYLNKSYPKDSLSTRKSKKKVLIESLHLPKVLNEKMIAAYVAINRLGNLKQGKKVFVNESLLDISNEEQVSIQRIKDIYVRNYNK
jgi:beta-lactamase class D